jgi:hypothetical protein
VFGLAVKPDTLSMQLTPPWPVQLRQLASLGVLMVAIVGLVVVLVRYRPRRTLMPFLILGLAVLVIAIDDVSFLGGVRPFDGGDDGLFYDHVGRLILQKLLAGDVAGFFQGGENVFYYGGPGLRYFRAFEHVIFGESYFGYVSLVLLLPFLLKALARRFLPADWSLALTLVFVAVPIGVLFGTSFVQYEKWAARGFADPAAYILFVAAIVPLIGAASSERRTFLPAFFSALLFALAIFVKPIVAPAAAVMLGGAGLAALSRRELARCAGLCLGFLPVCSMAVHNWVYGGVFVPFSANATNALVFVMPPSAYLAALHDLISLHWGGENLSRALLQIPNWLSGSAESYATIPLNAAGVAIVVWVVVCGRTFDPWLRLVGGAALAQHAVALFYVAVARYHFLPWLLTMGVVVAWLHEVGMGWFKRRYPDVCSRIASHPWSQRLASGLWRLQEVSS